MNVTIRDNVNSVPNREVVLIDVSNRDAKRMRVRGISGQQEYIGRLVAALFPNSTGYEVVYRYGKRGVSNDGFKAAVWVFTA